MRLLVVTCERVSELCLKFDDEIFIRREMYCLTNKNKLDYCGKTTLENLNEKVCS